MVEEKKKTKEKELIKETEIPEDIEARVESNELSLRYGEVEVKRRFSNISIEKKNNKIIVKTRRATKREKKKINTIASHIKNMLKGIKEGFVYKLQICAVHFPMNVSVDKAKNEVVIKNFLGETKERRAKILPGVEVKVDSGIIRVSSANKETAGQTAANIEKTAQSKNKDKRVFQDGIFMIEKAGRGI